MPEHDDHPEYLAPYIEALEASGPGFDATLWASPEGQVRRFDVLIELGDIAAHRILDVGCGPGDLAHRLVELNVPFTEYIGFDALEGMVVKAAGENLPRCRYEVVDVLAHPERMADVKPDIVVVSGTLNATHGCRIRCIRSRTGIQLSLQQAPSRQEHLCFAGKQVRYGGLA